MRGGYRPNAGRVSGFGRGVRLQARTLRMPEDVWDVLDAFSAARKVPPSMFVAQLLEGVLTAALWSERENQTRADVADHPLDDPDSDR